MLPVSVLPVAGILLGVGSAHFTWLPPLVSDVMAQSGGAIFGNLPLIFAIGVALGLTSNDGVAALAAVVGYVVMLATMGVMARAVRLRAEGRSWASSRSTPASSAASSSAASPAWLFNRYYRIQLPPYLGFFAGKRFVPIVTAFARASSPASSSSLVWPPIGRAIDAFSRWAAAGNPGVAFALYGVVERALLPFGLHHIWNVPFFFEVGQYLDPATGKVIRGEIYRFTAGDPTAGNLAGGYLFKMWGLPAAALAIWHSAQPGEPREGRRHHDLGRADVVPDRHHRADRVLVPVRRAAALRASTRCSPASRTSPASSSASSTARRSRTASSTTSCCSTARRTACGSLCSGRCGR